MRTIRLSTGIAFAFLLLLYPLRVPRQGFSMLTAGDPPTPPVTPPGTPTAPPGHQTPTAPPVGTPTIPPVEIPTAPPADPSLPPKSEAADHFLPLIIRAQPRPTETSTPPPAATSTLTSTATSTPRPTNTTVPPVATPTHTPTASPQSSGAVLITTIFFDGTGSSEPDEYVEIRNVHGHPVQLVGWTLRDEAGHMFQFPAFLMQPGQTCRVYTNQTDAEWCGFSYGSGSAIWNNTGECAYLEDSGGALVDSYCY